MKVRTAFVDNQAQQVVDNDFTVIVVFLTCRRRRLHCALRDATVCRWSWVEEPALEQPALLVWGEAVARPVALTVLPVRRLAESEHSGRQAWQGEAAGRRHRGEAWVALPAWAQTVVWLVFLVYYRRPGGLPRRTVCRKNCRSLLEQPHKFIGAGFAVQHHIEGFFFEAFDTLFTGKTLEILIGLAVDDHLSEGGGGWHELGNQRAAGIAGVIATLAAFCLENLFAFVFVV